MKYDLLSQIETKFKTDEASRLIPFSAKVAGENLTLNGMLYTPPRTEYYHPTAHTKQRIVLHYTAGNTRSDIMSLTRQNFHVSVAFVVARDGTIYQLHPSKYWSGHIGAGIGNQGTGNREDKASIGIEISNYGFLVPRDGNLETIYSRLKDKSTGKIGPIDLYCSETQTEAFTKIETPFRDQQFYSTFTPQQIESTIILLRFLTAKYQIPRQFLSKEKRFTTTNDVVNFKGIVSHVNYRSSGKWDIGPAFDWDKLIAGVQAAEFKASAGARSISRSATPVAKEAEVDVLFEKNWKKLNKNKAERSLEIESMEATDNEGYNPNDYDKQQVKEKAKTSSGKLFGLIVGINKYANIRKLYGCVGDATKIQKYLSSRADIETNIQFLKDDEATKKNVVAGFTKHLSKAKENDTVLFFYSGHGALEDAGTLWNESDSTLECLVCHDKDAKKSSDFLLTDKEIRYLISQLYKITKAHIVLIMDCCHSGDNSRAAFKVITTGDRKASSRFIVTDRPSGAFEARQWKDFVFAKEIAQPTKNKNIYQLLPESPHINLSACESNQSAMEYDGEGIFTKTLLKILQSSGSGITYNELHSRVAQVMRFTEEQTPKRYAPLLATQLLDKGFLNVDLAGGREMAEVTYNEETGWQINKGAIHNMHADTEVTIYNQGDRSKPVDASITEVFIDYSIVSFKNKLAQTKTHPAVVSGLLSRKILLELNNWHGNPVETKALVEAILQRAGGYYAFAAKEKNNEREPDYELHLRNGDVIITRPDDEFRPLVRPMPLVEEEHIDPIVSMLIHMAQWHFIKELKNTNAQSTFEKVPIGITISQKSTSAYKKLPIIDDSVSISYSKEGKDYKTFIKVDLKNNSSKKLYVAALYLDKNFMSYPGILSPNPHLLQAKETVQLELRQSNDLELRLGEQEQQYNWPLVTEYFQIIASEEDFDVNSLNLSPLPAPYILSDQGAKSIGESRGLVVDVADSSIPVKQWNTQLVELVAKNPLYNIIPNDKLKGLLEYEETTQFTAGIYYDVTLDEDGQPRTLTLKKGIKVPEGERGVLDDLKLWAANLVETLVRRKMYNSLRKNPSRMRIVAEGDSWFQYPILLKDTLDHLYKIYAIKSYAEAGDTLENYMKKREYLKGIREEKPKFFLISGGGNDILGEQFKDFLRSTPAQGDDTPRRFLNEKFDAKLNDLTKWYGEMFKELLDEFTDLQIITQSYDYAIPVDTNASPKTTSWLGRYMIQKGMLNPQDREDVIRYMVDKFNDSLKEASKLYPGNVSYVNVRGLIARDGWFDEIHPKDDGFQSIADRFVEIIEMKKKLIETKSRIVRSAKRDIVIEAEEKSVEMSAGEESDEPARLVRAPREIMATADDIGESRGVKANGGGVHRARTVGKKTASKKSKAKKGVSSESQFKEGQIDYLIPNVMYVAEPCKCTVRIAGKEVKKAVIKISDTSEHQSITITDEMSVRLVDVSGGKDFTIVSTNTEKQSIEAGQFTEWNFNVTPRKPRKGYDPQYTLLLSVTLHYANKKKDLPLIEKSVDVKKGKEDKIVPKHVVFTAADIDTALNITNEAKHIQSIRSRAKQKARFTFTKVLDLNVMKLKDILLKENPSILHYSGHSEVEGIYLFGEDNVPVIASTAALVELFDSVKDRLKIECFILNSCFSGAQANALKNYSQYIVGTTRKVGDTKAVLFSKLFYDGIFEGLDYRNAFKLAIAGLTLNDDKGVPIYNFQPVE